MKNHGVGLKETAPGKGKKSEELFFGIIEKGSDFFEETGIPADLKNTIGFDPPVFDQKHYRPNFEDPGHPFYAGNLKKNVFNLCVTAAPPSIQIPCLRRDDFTPIAQPEHDWSYEFPAEPEPEEEQAQEPEPQNEAEPEPQPASQVPATPPQPKKEKIPDFKNMTPEQKMKYLKDKTPEQKRNLLAQMKAGGSD
eukprot:SAG11_NODE_8249_length_1040_cov_9.708820_2_plen_194_part_00